MGKKRCGRLISLRNRALLIFAGCSFGRNGKKVSQEQFNFVVRQAIKRQSEGLYDELCTQTRIQRRNPGWLYVMQSLISAIARGDCECPAVINEIYKNIKLEDRFLSRFGYKIKYFKEQKLRAHINRLLIPKELMYIYLTIE